MPIGTHTTTSKLRQFYQAVIELIIPKLKIKQLKHPSVSFKVSHRQLVIASLAINLLALALPIMTLQVYDRILISENGGTLAVLAVGVGFMIILEGILRATRSYVIHWAGAVYEHAITSNAMRHMIYAERTRFHDYGTGEKLQRMEGISKLRDFFSGQTLITLIDLPFVLIFISLIGYLAGVLVLVPIVLLSIFATIAFYHGLSLKNLLKGREVNDRSRIEFLIESLNGIHTIKSHGLETMFLRRHEKIQADRSAINYFVAKANNDAANYGTIFTQAMIICIIGFGTPLAMGGHITLGTLIACVLLSGRIMTPIQRVLSTWLRYQDFQLAKDKIESTFSLQTIERDENESFDNNDGTIEIQDMSFSFGMNEPMLYDHVNLKIKRGEVIALKGDHNSGKTTLLKLIAGIYRPNHGNILINGRPSIAYPAPKLIKHLAYLPVEGTIYRGTIMDNLNAFGEIEPGAVDDIIKIFDFEKDIRKLPMGFETKLEGTPSDPIPVGLKQRISIARALANKPRIILFDHTDRALDKSGYNQIYQLLGKLKGKATMIIVSNDQNILQYADKEISLIDAHFTDTTGKKDSSLHDIMPYQELRT